PEGYAGEASSVFDTSHGASATAGCEAAGAESDSCGGRTPDGTRRTRGCGRGKPAAPRSRATAVAGTDLPFPEQRHRTVPPDPPASPSRPTVVPSRRRRVPRKTPPRADTGRPESGFESPRRSGRPCPPPGSAARPPRPDPSPEARGPADPAQAAGRDRHNRRCCPPPPAHPRHAEEGRPRSPGVDHHEGRPGVPLTPLPEDAGQLLDRGRLEDGAERQVPVELFRDPGKEPHGEERMPAQLEVVVVDTGFS